MRSMVEIYSNHENNEEERIRFCIDLADEKEVEGGTWELIVSIIKINTFNSGKAIRDKVSSNKVISQLVN